MLSNRYPKRGDIYRVNFAFGARIVMLWSPPDQCERYRRKRAKNPVNLTDSALRIIAMTIHVTDVAIVGGGMVGGATALGLAQQGFTVTVLEKAAPPAFDPASAPDVRISAISAASVGLLKSLGVWDAIRAMRVHAYRRLETGSGRARTSPSTPRSSSCRSWAIWSRTRFCNGACGKRWRRMRRLPCASVAN